MNVIIMLGHFKKSASILTNQETQMVGNDRWPATICNTVIMSNYTIVETLTCGAGFNFTANFTHCFCKKKGVLCFFRQGLYLSLFFNP